VGCEVRGCIARVARAVWYFVHEVRARSSVLCCEVRDCIALAAWYFVHEVRWLSQGCRLCAKCATASRGPFGTSCTKSVAQHGRHRGVDAAAQAANHALIRADRFGDLGDGCGD